MSKVTIKGNLVATITCIDIPEKDVIDLTCKLKSKKDLDTLLNGPKDLNNLDLENSNSLSLGLVGLYLSLEGVSIKLVGVVENEAPAIPSKRKSSSKSVLIRISLQPKESNKNS